MKLLAHLPVLVLLTLTVLGQDGVKPVMVSPKEMKDLAVRKEFVNVPRNVRNFHARGSIIVVVDVDSTGKVTKAKMLSGFSHIEFMKAYVEKTAATWRFKPRKVDGVSTAYRGVVSTVFWYGAFMEKAPY